MKTRSASEFKAKCMAVLDQIARTGERITVTKRERPVALVVPATRGDDELPQRRIIGSVEVVGDVATVG